MSIYDIGDWYPEFDDEDIDYFDDDDYEEDDDGS